MYLSNVGCAAIAVTAILFASSGVLARETCASGSFYAGLGLDRGALEYTDHFTTDFYDVTGVLGFHETSYANGAGYNHVYGTVLAGYETRYFRRFNMGLEAFYSIKPYTDNGGSTTITRNPFFGNPLETTTAWDNFHINNYYGIALIPGFQLQPDATINLRFGFGAGEMKWQQYQQDVFYTSGVSNVGTTGLINSFDVTRTKTLPAYTLGVGFKVRMDEHLAVGLGYNWTTFDSYDFLFTTDDPDPVFGGSEPYFTQRTPAMEIASAQLLYYFTPTEHYCDGPAARTGSEIYVGGFVVRDNTTINTVDHGNNSQQEFPAGVPADPTQNFANTLTSAAAGGFARGWGGEIFAGYGYTLSCGAYVGAEAFYNYTGSRDATNFVTEIPAGTNAAAAGSVQTGSTLDKLKGGYGLSFVTGYKQNNNIILYTKFGFVEREYNLVSTFATTIHDPRSLVLDNFDVTQELYGWQIGAGVDIRLCGSWFLRSEYVLNYFGEWERNRNTTPFLSASGNGFMVADDIAYSVLSGEFKLGLEYKFAV